MKWEKLERAFVAVVMPCYLFRRKNGPRSEEKLGKSAAILEKTRPHFSPLMIWKKGWL